MPAVFHNRWLPYLLLLPTLIVLVLFLYYPIVSTFQLSFYKAAPNGLDLTYISVENFQKLLDPQVSVNERTGVLQIKGEYYTVLGRSLLFSAVIVIGGLGL